MTAVDEEFGIEVDESSRRIKLEPSSMPDLGRQSWFERLFSSRRVSFELDVTLEVPVGTPLKLENRYGDITVEDIGGPADVNNTSGAVEIFGAVGDVAVENRYGDVTAIGIEGDLLLNVTSGALRIELVAGDADVTNSYGDVELKKVDGAAVVKVTSGAVTVEEIGAGSHGSLPRMATSRRYRSAGRSRSK